jgi:hypothetical protein
MVQLSATRCSCTAILYVSIVCFAAITVCVASQRVFIGVVVCIVMDEVRKLLDTPSHVKDIHGHVPIRIMSRTCSNSQGWISILMFTHIK